MRVIRQGDTQKTIKVYEGTCRVCGCIFEADEQEVKYENDPREPYHSSYCKCPTCGKDVWVKQKVFRG